MSLTTRCPACGTMFKVVPDQLRISEGWVRCGHCADVFDANLHLQGEDAAPAQPDVSTPKPGVQAPRHPEPVDLHSDSEDFPSSLNTEIGDDQPSEAPDSTQLDAEAQALREHPLDRPFELRREDAGEVSLPRPPPARRAARPEPEDELDDLSFVRQARRKDFWRGPMVRVLLVLALIASGLLLALQVAVHDRDRLAASDPSLRPFLSRLCAPLDCVVRAPRQIDAVVIDGSSFNRLRGEAYRLNVNLKNQAAMPVAMPALELTLTDGQDQPLVRRVLMPSELGQHPGVIAAASEWSGSLTLALSDSGSGSRIAGYRLLAFYP